uniref:DH domain-containing protein n=1 Tax=Petromyzon marinus TaxID=7757 RepID=S4RMC1_PETMA
GPKRPVSLGSTSSSSSSRDSHLSFGSSLVLASSPSSSLAPGDSGCSCSERDAFSDREPEVRESDILELEEEDTRRSSSGSSGSSGSQETGRPGKEGTRVRMTLAADGCSLSSLERVLLEMLQTERAYVRDLSSIVQDYLGCMEATPGLPLSSQDLGTLFGNVRSIYFLNRDLLQDLEVCGLDPVAAARCFISKSEAFQIYTEYCMNYPNTVGVVHAIPCNCVLSTSSEPRCARYKFQIVVISHKYKCVRWWLCRQLLGTGLKSQNAKRTATHRTVLEALDTMTGVAQHINEVKRRHEQASRVQEIERLLSSWHGPELGRYGELVLEGVFRVARARNQRTFFLFTNILLFARRRDHIYVCKGHILIECKQSVLYHPLVNSNMDFHVPHTRNRKLCHQYQAHSVEEKRLWVHELKRLILENYPSDIPLKAKQAILDMD